MSHKILKKGSNTGTPLFFELWNDLYMAIGVKRFISFFLCMTLIAGILSGCSFGGGDERIITPIDSDPDYLDPQIIYQTGAKNIVLNCFEGLVSYNENGELVPAAAESYDVSDNGLTYTFNLRKDGKWRVTTAAKKILGEEKANRFDARVTANDFVFALRRALQPETLCPYAKSLMRIKNAAKVNSGSLSSDKLGVKARNDYTLVITLERADSDFLSVLTLPSCMPCNEEFFNCTKGRYGLSADNLIYNGPFYISNWAENTAITARRNNDYHSLGEKKISTEVKPSSIYFSFNNEKSTRGRKVSDGTYDLSPISASQAQEIAQKRRLTVKSFKSAVTSLIFNCEDEVMKNQEMRKAMVYSLDSKIFLESFGKEQAVGVVPSSCVLSGTSYREKAKAFNTNPTGKEKALKFLEDGKKKLELDDVELKILCSTDNENIVRVAMQQWQSVFGVSFGISVEAVEQSELEKRIEAGEYQIALYDLVYTDIFAETAVSRFAKDSRGNAAKLSKKQYDDIIGKLSSAGDKNKTDLIEQAESYLISCCVVMPICETDVYYGMAKGVSGIIFSPTGETALFKNTVIK